MRQKLTTSSQTLFTKLPEGCYAAVVWLELRGPCTSRASRIPGRIRQPGEEDAPVLPRQQPAPRPSSGVRKGTFAVFSLTRATYC